MIQYINVLTESVLYYYIIYIFILLYNYINYCVLHCIIYIESIVFVVYNL